MIIAVLAALGYDAKRVYDETQRKWHLHNVFAKTGTTNRAGLLRLALTS